MAISVKQKKVTVATSGVPVQFDSSLTTAAFIATAGESNSGTIYVGDSNVDAGNALGQSATAGESVNFEAPSQYGTEEVLDLSKFYVDSTSSGDTIIVTYFVREG